MVKFRTWLLGCLLVGLAAVSGCNPREAIEHYRVEKPPPIEAPEPTDRTLAAVVPVGSQGWFFKLTGSKDQVADKEADFMAFLKSVHFSAEEKPEWTLPEGWQHRAGSDIRYATLVIGGQPNAKPLEVSVTVLPKSGDDEDYALVNINRWRGQLMLPPIEKVQLAAESSRVELAGATATFVNLVGTATTGGMGRGPFFSGAGDGK